MSADEVPGSDRALSVISLAVLLASSTWFSGTAAVPALIVEFGIESSFAASATTSVQLGFIAGTLLFAVTNVTDIFNPRLIFCLAAVGGAAFNIGFALLAITPWSALAFRFFTGVALAGVYPVAMKIVATWFRTGLGWRLGVLVGALTIGTATPYLLVAIGTELPWRIPVLMASAAAVLGGTLVAFLGDGPHLSGRARFDVRVVGRAFAHPPFRHTAFGYFGHMWELYALWSMIAFWLGERFSGRPPWPGGTAGLAFTVIGAGAIGCVVGGRLSRRIGEKRVALLSLLLSGTFCGLSGLVFALPDGVVVAILFAWGVVVVSDSPQFSALAARHAPAGYVGTALTIQNGIGFAITVASIELVPRCAAAVGWRWAFTILAVGPLLGAVFVRKIPTD